jgi:protocatechuate 3,4-dioxygenase beta subunit
VLDAVVLDHACAPVTGATVNVWQTDGEGRYGPEREKCCYYQATVLTDHNGRLRVDTVRPAQYPQAGAPPAHIHVEIEHTSGGLMTEVVFGTNPTPPARVRASDVITVYPREGPDAWRAEVTFVLWPGTRPPR